jgi:hypothetical protein
VLHALAVDIHRIAAGVAAAIPPGVHQDREQPGPKIRARLEPGAGAKGLHERVLDEVVRFHRAARQAERGAIQRVELAKGGALEVLQIGERSGTRREAKHGHGWREPSRVEPRTGRAYS